MLDGIVISDVKGKLLIVKTAYNHKFPSNFTSVYAPSSLWGQNIIEYTFQKGIKISLPNSINQYRVIPYTHSRIIVYHINNQLIYYAVGHLYEMGEHWLAEALRLLTAGLTMTIGKTPEEPEDIVKNYGIISLLFEELVSEDAMGFGKSQKKVSKSLDKVQTVSTIKRDQRKSIKTIFK